MQLFQTFNGALEQAQNSPVRGVQKLAYPVGIISILSGFVFNQAFIEFTFVQDHEIKSWLFRAVIFGLQISAVLFGTYVLLYRNKVSANLLLVISSVFCSLLLAELLLQLFYKPAPLTSGFKAYVSKFEQNQLGFRGQHIEYSPDDFVIVLLGDSFVQAQACAYGWMPERRLEHYLKLSGKKVRVFTVGAAGWGQDQQLLAMREYYEKYRADWVLLWETPANDVWNNIFPMHWLATKPTFWLENGELRGPSEEMGAELTPSSVFKLVVLLQNLRGVRVDRDKQWEKYLPRPYKPLTQYHGRVNQQWQQYWDANFGSMRDENFENERNHRAIFLTPRSDRMQYGLELTRTLLHEIQSLVRSHKGRFSIFRPDLPWNDTSANEEVYVLNGKYYLASAKQFEANMQYLNHEFESYLLPVTIEDWKVGPENRHLNEHATDELMKVLANTVKPLIAN